MNPDDKVLIHSPGHGTRESQETNAELNLLPLTPEVLRDLARNESVDRNWRKAAIKFLIKRNHNYANHGEFKELLEEIKEEQLAEQEVKAIVESATEEPLED